MGLKESGLRGSLRSTSSVLPEFFDVTITNTNSPVQEGDILTVDYSADNTGDAQDTQDIRLEIDSVEEDRDSDITLLGAQSTTGTLEWDTTNEDETTYTATVLSNDDTDSVTVEIEAAIPDSGDFPESDSIESYWIIDDNNSTVVDEVGDNDGTVVGGNWQSEDDLATDFSLFLNDDSDRIETGLDVGGWSEMTVVTVAKLANVTSDERQYFAASEGSDQSERPFVFSAGNDGMYKVSLNRDTIVSVTDDVLTANQYEMQSFAYDGSEVRLYLDDDKKDTGSFSEELMPSPSGGTWIGNSEADPTRGPDGNLGYTIIWDTGLTDSQIADVFDLVIQ